MGCGCGRGSTLILCDFVEFDTWLREWTMGCDCVGVLVGVGPTVPELMHCGS